MEKKIIAILVIAACVLAVTMPAFSEEAKTPQEPEIPGNPINKFGRGMCNLVTFPMEIIEQSKRVKAEYGSTAGMSYGMGRGLLMAGVRAIVGVYEVATFFIPYPVGYKPILTDPVSFFPQPRKLPE